MYKSDAFEASHQLHSQEKKNKSSRKLITMWAQNGWLLLKCVEPLFLDDTRGGVTLFVKCAQWPCTHAGERESPDQRDTRRVCWKSGIFVRCDTAVTIAAGPLQPGATDGAGPQLILRYVLLSNVTQHRRTPSALLWGCFNRLRAPRMSPAARHGFRKWWCIHLI